MTRRSVALLKWLPPHGSHSTPRGTASRHGLLREHTQRLELASEYVLGLLVTQELLDERLAGAGVDRAKGLEAVGAAGNDGLVGAQTLEHKVQERGGDERQVAGQQEDGGGWGQRQGGVEAPERARVGAQIGVDGQLEVGEGVPPVRYNDTREDRIQLESNTVVPKVSAEAIEAATRRAGPRQTPGPAGR